MGPDPAVAPVLKKERDTREFGGPGTLDLQNRGPAFGSSGFVSVVSVLAVDRRWGRRLAVWRG